MILGIGIDAVNLNRVEKLSRRTLEKLFHEEELKEYDNLSNACIEVKNAFLASRFAVKEAYSKAVGHGFDGTVIPKEIRTCKKEGGQPFIVLYGVTKEKAPVCNIFLSITHEEPLAIAMVVLETGENCGKK
ncbi:MAG: holo-ACP synthase [Sphaerochaetaceae bacterium]|nr:holo-ACP synthase [Sphaerochaetaceae bacterium]